MFYPKRGFQHILNRFSGLRENEKKKPLTSQKLVKLASKYIHFIKPEIIGVAFMELDCKCVKLLGIQNDGKPLVPVTLALSKLANSAYHPPKCPICNKDGGHNVKRLARYGIVWILEKHRKPGRKLRKIITRKLFGAGYGAAEQVKLRN